jgi:hypothetical protein
MAVSTTFELEFQGMGVVTLVTGLIPIYVGEDGVIGLTIILISALGLRAILGGRGSVVVDVLKAQILADFIIFDTGLFESFVDADG